MIWPGKRNGPGTSRPDPKSFWLHLYLYRMNSSGEKIWLLAILCHRHPFFLFFSLGCYFSIRTKCGFDNEPRFFFHFSEGTKWTNGTHLNQKKIHVAFEQKFAFFLYILFGHGYKHISIAEMWKHEHKKNNKKLFHHQFFYWFSNEFSWQFISSILYARCDVPCEKRKKMRTRNVQCFLWKCHLVTPITVSFSSDAICVWLERLFRCGSPLTLFLTRMFIVQFTVRQDKFHQKFPVR